MSDEPKGGPQGEWWLVKSTLIVLGILAIPAVVFVWLQWMRYAPW